MRYSAKNSVFVPESTGYFGRILVTPLLTQVSNHLVDQASVTSLIYLE
jgi:hypothetical protein